MLRLDNKEGQTVMKRVKKNKANVSRNEAR
jgi:hypothetical protein